jgi:hypothetical protein
VRPALPCGEAELAGCCDNALQRAPRTPCVRMDERSGDVDVLSCSEFADEDDNAHWCDSRAREALNG